MSCVTSPQACGEEGETQNPVQGGGWVIMDGVKEQVDKAPLLGNTRVQAVKKIHTTSAVFSKQTVVPEGRVCVSVSRQNSFVPGYVPLYLKQGFSQPPQQ